MKEVFEDEEIKSLMIEKNQGQLKDKHVRGDGTPITRIYSSVSQSKYGKPNSEITLYDTGEFYGSMKVRSDDSGVTISGQTLKDGEKGIVDISGYVGGNPMGLTDESKNEIMPNVKNKAIEKYKEATGFSR